MDVSVNFYSQGENLEEKCPPNQFVTSKFASEWLKNSFSSDLLKLRR